MHSWKILAQWSSRHAHAAIALAATVVGLLLFAYSGIGQSGKAAFVFLQDIEQRSLDFRFLLRGRREPDPRIVIVGMDEKTLQEIGSFPLPRSSYALLVRQLKQDGARVIGFDEDFPLPAGSEALSVLSKLEHDFSGNKKEEQELEAAAKRADVDAQFADALKDAGNVVLGHLFLDADRARFADPKQAQDYLNIVLFKAFPQIFPVGSKNLDMAKAWQDAGGPVYQGVEPNLLLYTQSAASYGFFNINSDGDGTLRRALLMSRYGKDDYFPSLDLMILQQFESIPDQQIAAYISPDGLERIQFGSHNLHPRTDGTALINYVGPYRSYPQYSMTDVVHGRVPAEVFRDKIVLVGATALAIGDLRNTPFSQGSSYMGVEVHANILDNLLHSAEPHRTFLVRSFREEMVDIGFIILFGAIFGVWLGRTRPLTATAATIVLLTLFAGFVYFGFVHWGRWYSLVVPGSTLILAYLGSISYRVFFEEREKRKIRKQFGMFLAPGVIALIEKDPDKYFRPGGETKELSILFSDIRDFTTMSEGMSPDDLVRMLNEYFNAMIDVLYKNLGTLDKFIGDAIMAFWGSPYPQEDHAFHACNCALQMRDRLIELNSDWERRGMRHIAIGLGINSGPVSVGNIGSEKRLSWTVMGDNVNLASRLEGMTKQYRVAVLINETTHEQVKEQF
ncbi:MAG TPA: adenylate/guanylate cyclase domain-containing protein, partial [Terriglobales bacterium]|nr:adenylate/guanylate cyclase domain-containing protein [Terriglobales bacterium]